MGQIRCLKPCMKYMLTDISAMTIFVVLGNMLRAICKHHSPKPPAPIINTEQAPKKTKQMVKCDVRANLNILILVQAYLNSNEVTVSRRKVFLKFNQP